MRAWDKEGRREGPPCLQSRWQVKAERSALKAAIPIGWQHPEHKGLDPSTGCSNTGDITCLPLPDTRCPSRAAKLDSLKIGGNLEECGRITTDGAATGWNRETYSFRSAILNWRWFSPLPGAHLAMSGDIPGCHKQFYWYQVGKDQRNCQTPYNAQDSPHNRDLSKCQYAEVEKPFL